MPGEDEKKLRTSAKRKFTRVYNRFREAIENDTEIDIVTAKYADIKILWNEVQSKHEDYLFTAFPDEDEPTNAAEEDTTMKGCSKVEMKRITRLKEKKHRMTNLPKSSRCRNRR